MTERNWWIVNIDFRISTGVIYFFLLLLWGKGNKRKNWLMRLVLSAVALCGSSWILRYVIETKLTSVVSVAFGYSIHTLVMIGLFLLCFHFCYLTTINEYLFRSLSVYVVFKIAWYTLKAVIGFTLLNFMEPWGIKNIGVPVLSYTIYFSIAIICFAIFSKIVKTPCTITPHILGGVAGLILSCQIILEWSFRVVANGPSASFLFYFASVFYCAFNFGLMLLMYQMETLRMNNTNMQNFIKGKRQYYQMSREGILSLQSKCHDLKHQIALIRSSSGKMQFERYLEDLENSIDEYNIVIKTGNEAIDVVLTEKNILCNVGKIKFTYIIDGSLFSFLTDIEIYALFGNTLDNAIESARKVKDIQKRIISLKAARLNNSVLLHVENFFEDPPHLRNGFPATTKSNSALHGFGLRSIIQTVEKHGGNVSFSIDEQIFKLNILLPKRQC